MTSDEISRYPERIARVLSRLALPSAWWLRILEVLERDFGPVPVFVDTRGTPRVFVVGGEDRVAVMFTTVPDTVLAALPGRRACDVVGHPAFASGSRNGGHLVVGAIPAAAPGEPAAAIVLTFDLPLDVSGSRSMGEFVAGAALPLYALGARPGREDGL